jgi:hypothetical protein
VLDLNSRGRIISDLSGSPASPDLTAAQVLEKHRSFVRLPFRSRTAAVACFCLAPCLAVIGFVISLGLNEIATLEDKRFGFFAVIVCVVGGCLLCVLGRRLWLPDALTVVRSDTRPPVLYLRAFANDENVNAVQDMIAIVGTLVMWGPLWILRALKLTGTVESRLSDVLRTLGPVIAIARPDEILNVPTASRLKLDAEHWQMVVADLIAAAALVVVDVSSSDGLRFEVECASTPANRRRLLIALPVGNAKKKRGGFAYNHACDLMSDVFDYRLGDTQEDLAFISFDLEGRPQEHRLVKAWSISRLVFGRLRMTWIEALQSSGYRPVKPYWRRAAGAAVLAGVPAVLILSGLAEFVVQDVHDKEEMRQFAERDTRWRREFNAAIEGERRGEYMDDRLAEILEMRVATELEIQRANLTTSCGQANGNNKQRLCALASDDAAALRAVTDFSAALRRHDAVSARAAIGALTTASNAINASFGARRH